MKENSRRGRRGKVEEERRSRRGGRGVERRQEEL